MASPRIGGAGIPLNLTNALGGPLPNQAITPVTAFNPTRGSNAVTLQAGEFLQIPAGTYLTAPGPYTSLQWLDPVTNIYRTVSAENSLQMVPLDSDGGNWRLANLTGCAIGALITNSGSSYANGIGSTATNLTVTASSGGSVWVPVVGGAINSSLTITAAGSGYLYPPNLVFDAPPVGGIQATGYCTISGGAITGTTVTNQGAGYVTAPAITLINDPRDTAGTGGILTVNATLAGSGTLTALYPSNYGTSLTSTPTFTFTLASGGTGSGAAATCIMNYVVTGFTIASGSSGAGYGNAQPFLIQAVGGQVATGSRASNVAGPIADVNLTSPQTAIITGTSSAGGKIATASSVVVNNGFGFQGTPTAFVWAGGTGLATTTAAPTLTVGGVTDTSWMQPV